MYFFFLLSLLISYTLAQYPPSQQNLTTIQSPVDGNITITFKTPPRGTCTTVFDSQQQYTGWVHIPGSYPTNTFFWFIAARQQTSQLTVWLNGGPGSSSMVGLFNGNGPCEAIEVAQGKFGTKARDWGWDRGSNMLYIDQPNLVGFSYDTPTNCSLDLLTQALYTPPQQLPNSQPAYTFMNGTYSSLNQSNTANTTQIAAMAIWHMVQAFLGSFPQPAPDRSSSQFVGVNLFAESYGGKYGPAFATLWEEQNKRRLNGSISASGSVPIKLVSLGIVNGCIDDLIQAPYYPVMAINNTYGITTINPTRAALANASFYSPGGCQDLINQCRTAVDIYDPQNNGDVDTVNHLCSSAQASCANNVMNPYSDSGRSVYDIGRLLPDSFPPSTYLEYLNSENFLAAIGSPINYTEVDPQVVNAFLNTGDMERESYIPAIADLLNAGVRVGLIYGDRDYICNWMGGEAMSLRIAARTSGTYFARFTNAGYAPIIVNTSYIGGVVRQFGNLSFSRIYDAGHQVPAYQPETAFQVFARIIGGTSVSTGEIIDLSLYNSTGPASASHTNALPPSPTNTCWLRNIPGTCTNEQKNKILNNQGVIINGVLYDKASDWKSPAGGAFMTQGSSGMMVPTGTYTTVTQVLTGLYTATATPTNQSAASRQDLSWLLIWIVCLGSLLLFV
jgi:carboxypeptidase C (cathepsin A)